MLSKYLASRTRHEFLSICQVCILNELFRFGSGLCGLLQKQDCIASLHFRLCNGTRHKPRNGTDNLLRPGDKQSSEVSRIERESQAFRCNLTLHEYFSRISTLMEDNSAFWTSEVLIILH